MVNRKNRKNEKMTGSKSVMETMNRKRKEGD
jgi:hypothetical protein